MLCAGAVSTCCAIAFKRRIRSSVSFLSNLVFSVWYVCTSSVLQMLWAVRSWMLTCRVQAPRAGPGRSPNWPNRFGVSSPQKRKRRGAVDVDVAVARPFQQPVAVVWLSHAAGAAVPPPFARGRGDVSRSGGLGGRGVAARR